MEADYILSLQFQGKCEIPLESVYFNIFDEDQILNISVGWKLPAVKNSLVIQVKLKSNTACL